VTSTLGTEALPASRFSIGGVARHSLIYGVGIVLSKSVSFVMLPVYTRFLTPGDYGVMELIDMSLDVIAMMAGGGLAVGIFRFYHKATSDAERNSIVSTALLALATSYLLVAMVTFLFASQLSALVFQSTTYAPLVRIAAGSLAFQSLLIAPLAYIRVRHKSTVFVAANLAKLVLALVLNIVFVVGYRMGARGVLTSTLISTAIVGTALGLYTLRQVGLSWSPKALRSLLRYGTPLVLTQFATFIATFGDRYFLQHASQLTTVGIYTLAYQFGFMLGTIGYMPLELVWAPMRFQVANRADRDEIYARVFVYLNLVLITVAVGITLFISDLLHLMTTPAFYPAASIVPLILVAYVLQGWAGVQDIGIHIRERTSLLTLSNWLSAAAAIAGYALLIPRYLGMGAAVATIIAFAVRYGTTYVFAQSLWPVKYRWQPVIRMIGAGVVACIIGAFVPSEADPLASIAMHAVLFACYLFAVWHIGVLSLQERAQVKQVLQTARGTLVARLAPQRAA
jgi:O-antigen/teichoic acid export membrane protein